MVVVAPLGLVLIELGDFFLPGDIWDNCFTCSGDIKYSFVVSSLLI